MKTILLAFALLFSLSSTAQIAKQPKLRMVSGVFTVKYELGDKTVNSDEVQAHLEKNSPEAYHVWRKANSAETTSLILSIVGIAGATMGLVSDDDVLSSGGYVVAASGVLGALLCTLTASARREKAADIYNKKYGYQ